MYISTYTYSCFSLCVCVVAHCADVLCNFAYLILKSGFRYLSVFQCWVRCGHALYIYMYIHRDIYACHMFVFMRAQCMYIFSVKFVPSGLFVFHLKCLCILVFGFCMCV